MRNDCLLGRCFLFMPHQAATLHLLAQPAQENRLWKICWRVFTNSATAKFTSMKNRSANTICPLCANLLAWSPRKVFCSTDQSAKICSWENRTQLESSYGALSMRQTRDNLSNVCRTVWKAWWASVDG